MQMPPLSTAKIVPEKSSRCDWVQVAEAVGVASMRRSMLAQTADFMQLGLAPMQVRLPLLTYALGLLVRIQDGGSPSCALENLQCPAM